MADVDILVCFLEVPDSDTPVLDMQVANADTFVCD